MRSVLAYVGLGATVVFASACGGSSLPLVGGNTDAGSTGTSGGSSGANASTGATGAAGGTGVTAIGVTGAAGTAGAGGATGTTGAAGATGTSATTGAAGTAAASGTTGATGTGAMSGTAGAGGGTAPMPTMLPIASGTCPSIASAVGSTNGTVLSFGGQNVTVWAGAKTTPPGPLVVYWYATGSSVAEARAGLDIPTILAHGGVVAAQNATTKMGTNTGDLVWFTGDFNIADQVVACGIQENYIDPRRIHAAGYSAGGLQTAWMTFARSNYMASVITYSGGMTGAGMFSLDPAPSTSNVAAVLAAHGQMDMGSCNTPTMTDCLGEDFFVASHAYEANVKGRGGFAIDCTDGGGHISSTRLTSIAPVAYTFFAAHPFMVRPEPWTALPAGFPSDCTIE